MNDIAARRSMTDATGRLNLSCRGRECGKRPNQRLCSVSSRRSHFRVSDGLGHDGAIAARQQELRSELPLLVLPQIRMSQVPPRRRTIGPDMEWPGSYRLRTRTCPSRLRTSSCWLWPRTCRVETTKQHGSRRGNPAIREAGREGRGTSCRRPSSPRSWSTSKSAWHGGYSGSVLPRGPRWRGSPASSDEIPARCHRITVSGRMIVMALRTDGNQRYNWMKNRRSLLVNWTRPRTWRCSTMSCCLSAAFSASSQLSGLNNDAPRFKRKNISATIAADVKRFCHQIKNGQGFRYAQSMTPACIGHSAREQ